MSDYYPGSFRPIAEIGSYGPTTVRSISDHDKYLYHDREPLSNDTAVTIIGLVVDLTPDPENGKKDPFVFRRENTISDEVFGVVSVARKGLFDKSNPHANEYRKNKFDHITSIVTIQSEIGIFSMSVSEEGVCTITRRVQRDQETIITTLSEQDALELVEVLQMILDREQAKSQPEAIE